MKVLKNPRITGPVLIFARAVIFLISSIPAPTNTGIARKNEKRAASFRCIPKNNAVAMVIPDREMPGKMAIAWAHPIINAVDHKIVLFSPEHLLVVNKIHPVHNNATETNTIFSK